jgi:hypothetical protein
MKYAVSWEVAPCRSCENRRFGGACHLRLQVEMNLRKCMRGRVNVCYTLQLLFPEDEDNMFLETLISTTRLQYTTM